MKKISFLIALGILVLPTISSAMTLGDVLTQHSLYKKEAYSAPSVLGASTDGRGMTTMQKKTAITAEAGKTLVKGLRYSEGSSAIVSKPIKRGMDKSDEVKKLQLFLIAKGYLEADPTGKYGAQTIAAVKKFQAEKGIKGDGTLVGPATRAAIEQEVATMTSDIQQ